MTAAPIVYEFDAHLERIADQRGAVSDYLIGLAQVRAACSIANELVALRETFEAIAASLDQLDGTLSSMKMRMPR